MKKILLASSALVAATAISTQAFAAEDGIKIEAFTHFHASTLDADGAEPSNGVDFNTNSEVKIFGQKTADNGLIYGFAIELETDQDSTENTDENHLFVKGDFGHIEFGDQDGAADKLGLGGVNVEMVNGMIDNGTGSAIKVGLARTAAGVRDSSDSTKITYYTPNFSGFTAGLSYTPDVETGQKKATDDSDSDFIEAGLKYEEKINDIKVGLALAGSHQQFSESAAVGVTGEGDYWGAHTGATLGYAGFTVGAGYSYETADADVKGLGLNIEGYRNTFDAGISYETGPWRFAVAGVWSKAEAEAILGNAKVTDDTTNKAISAGLQYAVAPGLEVYGSVITGDYESGSGNFTGAQSGVKLSF